MPRTLAEKWQAAAAVVIGGFLVFVTLVSLDAGGLSGRDLLRRLLGQVSAPASLEMPAAPRWVPDAKPGDRLYSTSDFDEGTPPQPPRDAALRVDGPVTQPSPQPLPTAQAVPRPPERAMPKTPAPAPVRRLVVTKHLGADGLQYTAARANSRSGAPELTQQERQTQAAIATVRQVSIRYGAVTRDEIMVRAVGRVLNLCPTRERRR